MPSAFSVGSRVAGPVSFGPDVPLVPGTCGPIYSVFLGTNGVSGNSCFPPHALPSPRRQLITPAAGTRLVDVHYDSPAVLCLCVVLLCFCLALAP